MKNKKSRFGARSKMALAATMMTIPMFAVAQKPNADASPTDKSASSRSATHDKATGAQKFPSTDVAVKQGAAYTVKQGAAYKQGADRSAHTKAKEKVTIVGKDAKGH